MSPAVRRWGGGALRSLPALVYATGIFHAGTAAPSGGLPRINDKLAHCIGFAVLAMLCAFALGQFRPSTRSRPRLILAAAASVAVGALLELVQSFIPHRSAEFLDLVADALGALLGVLPLWLIASPRSERERATGQADG